MVNRHTFPPTREWVNALNLIDVIFADDKKVLDLWHRLYQIVTTVPLAEEQFLHTSLDLLKQMADSLGYGDLKQTDIDKFYVPQIHGDMAARAAAAQEEFILMLKNFNLMAAAAQAKTTTRNPAPQGAPPIENAK